MSEAQERMELDYDTGELEAWDEKIREKVEAFGLTCYDQEFELCDHTQMLGAMAYHGMPAHYPHWSYGKSFERQSTLYNHGVSGLPYEMVINASPSLAYLMTKNSLCLQILTIAHVYAHNDFFRNNATFKFTRADSVIPAFKARADRVRGYIEDPSIGMSRVEPVLDAAHALSMQCSRNPAIRKLSLEEQKERAMAAARPPTDEYHRIHKRPEYVEPDLGRVPLEPDENILLFIRDYQPRLAEWERDLLTIVHEEAQYFIPQMETKIMNEGWATYWHREIMNSLELPQGIHLEFLVRHNQVVQPAVGEINPYHVGLKLWDDIVRRYDHPTDEEIERYGKPSVTGREKMFELRETDRDSSFLRRFLTEDLCGELGLFEFQSQDGALVVTETPEEGDWKTIRETLLRSVGTASIPVIKVQDADHRHNGTLLLNHEHDGRDLHLGYAEHSLAHVFRLWGRPVELETLNDGELRRLRYDNAGFHQAD
jgi:stage V sporulation protein R